MANQEMERALVFAGYEAMHAWGDGGHNGKHATEVFPQAMRWLWKDWWQARATPDHVPTASGAMLSVLVSGKVSGALVTLAASRALSRERFLASLARRNQDLSRN